MLARLSKVYSTSYNPPTSAQFHLHFTSIMPLVCTSANAMTPKSRGYVHVRFLGLNARTFLHLTSSSSSRRTLQAAQQGTRLSSRAAHGGCVVFPASICECAIGSLVVHSCPLPRPHGDGDARRIAFRPGDAGSVHLGAALPDEAARAFTSDICVRDLQAQMP